MQWITSIFAPFAIHRISMWIDMAGHHASELEEFDAVYIGGGNTYALLGELIASGFDRHLHMYANRGGIVYGGSAGAVVLGKDIRTISDMDRNEIALRERLKTCQNGSEWANLWDDQISTNLPNRPE
jgi:dipeptidase E